MVDVLGVFWYPNIDNTKISQAREDFVYEIFGVMSSLTETVLAKKVNVDIISVIKSEMLNFSGAVMDESAPLYSNPFC